MSDGRDKEESISHARKILKNVREDIVKPAVEKKKAINKEVTEKVSEIVKEANLNERHEKEVKEAVEQDLKV